MEETRAKSVKVVIISLTIGLILISVMIASRSYPGYKVNAYIEAINNGKFEKVYELTYKDEVVHQVSKAQYVAFLQRYFATKQFVTMEKGKQTTDGQAYNVKYVFEDRIFEQRLGIVKKNNRWYIQNPFSIDAIHPTLVPVQEQVTEEKQQEGQKEKEPIEAVTVKKQETVESFMNRFYQDYIKGIKQHESTFIKNYTLDTSCADITSEYEMWYIANKNVLEAKIRVELGEIEETKDGKISLEVFEIAQLLNEEKVENKFEQKYYQVTTSWTVKLQQHDNAYKITDKILGESVVSYLDENEEWIAY